MLTELTPSELGEWIAEYTLSPWGDWREDFRTGQLAALYAESHRDPTKRSEPFLPKHFMFEYLAAQNAELSSEELSLKIKSGLAHLIRKKGKRK